MSRVRVVAAAGLVLLAGCGAAAGSGHTSPAPTTATIAPPAQRSLLAPSPSTAPATPPPGNVLTAADSGATVRLRTGQRLIVDLMPGPGAYAWDRPRLSGSALRLVSAAGGYPDHGRTRAVFLAAGPGTAVLSASTDMPCLHTPPRCLIAQRVWTVRVIVSA
jgi:hypothetical protein